MFSVRKGFGLQRHPHKEIGGIGFLHHQTPQLLSV